MNNALLITQKADDKLEKTVEDMLASDEATLTQNIRSLSALKDNVHFKRYITSVITPRLKKKEKLLNKETDTVKIYRLQGGIDELKELSLESIDTLLKNLKNKLNRIWQKNQQK